MGTAGLSKGTERGVAAISALGDDVGTEDSYRNYRSDHASDPAELLKSASRPYALCYGRGSQSVGAHAIL